MTRAASPSKQPASRTAWLVVDSTGWVSSAWPLKEDANRIADNRRLTAFAPHTVVRVSYPWPPVSRAKRGEK